MRLIVLALVAFTATSATSPTVDFSGVARLASRPLEDAVVWLEAPGIAPLVTQSQPVLNQRDVQFSPHVLAVQVGTKVKFPNADRVFHNVFSFRDGKRFDLGLYPVGMVKELVFDKPGLSRVFCNIHPQMAAYILAVETPFFAVSDAQGRFTIAGAPRGVHYYHAWRPGGVIVSAEVDVGAEEAFEVHWP